MISRTVVRVAGYTRKVANAIQGRRKLRKQGEESESWAPSHQLRMHCQNQSR
jgi:hypothetical protein